jgi:hypothetical protein
MILDLTLFFAMSSSAELVTHFFRIAHLARSAHVKRTPFVGITARGK